MLPTFTPIHLLYLFIAVAFDVVANILIKLSHGLERKFYFFSALFFVLSAFTALSFAVKGIELAVAYSIWGGLGLIATALFGIWIFKERLRFSGWLGIVLLISGIILMKMS